MLTVNFHPYAHRRAARRVAIVLAALALTALFFRLDAADPVVATLAVCAAVCIAWVVLDIARAAWRAAQGAKRERRAESSDVDRPGAHSDTQST
jgi:hypothetical protein